ncbi:hypothetical protein FA95DRAFT_511361 [Auriscalpium vulgare]|uniref:Uncharacterized protein n=1 Tax=Auriscalpium vulgare TaxID=40419 RepID=A0ACB8RG21_9AGAM|nr:hypothetical protein FA95DRAFT_511361 [Auriscalpium vulgare]
MGGASDINTAQTLWPYTSVYYYSSTHLAMKFSTAFSALVLATVVSAAPVADDSACTGHLCTLQRLTRDILEPDFDELASDYLDVRIVINVSHGIFEMLPVSSPALSPFASIIIRPFPCFSRTVRVVAGVCSFRAHFPVTHIWLVATVDDRGRDTLSC